MRPLEEYLLHHDQLTQANAGAGQEYLRLLSGAYARLYRQIVSLVGNLHDADDVLQDVCVVLWEKFPQYDSQGNFGHWASVIAVNVCRNFLRKKNRRYATALHDEIATQVAHVHNGTSELLELRRETLRQCLGKLSEQEHELLQHVYGNRDSVVELAEKAGHSPNRLYGRLFRIRKRLMDCINQTLWQGKE